MSDSNYGVLNTLLHGQHDKSVGKTFLTFYEEMDWKNQQDIKHSCVVLTRTTRLYQSDCWDMSEKFSHKYFLWRLPFVNLRYWDTYHLTTGDMQDGNELITFVCCSEQVTIKDSSVAIKKKYYYHFCYYLLFRLLSH